MPLNRLAGEVSPYLLQHRENPVDWWPWGADALKAAATTNKPILVSIGYAACHWCHVMAHESFEDTETAEIMNANFINIKVDREERPDIDQIYMSALHALGEQGGWPLTMFLDSKARPFWGGTYFPKTSQYGRPSFQQILEHISRVYREDPDRIDNNQSALMEFLNRKIVSRETLHFGFLDEAAKSFLGLYDPENGGLKGAPKFPQSMWLEALYRSYHRTGEQEYLKAFSHSMRQIAQGGIYDHLGGGFCRYSVDERWLAPHFEKMLYDNALLLDRLMDGDCATGSELFRDRIDETIAFLLSEFRGEQAGFFASQDADSEGEEGKFYTWTAKQISAALPAGQANAFMQAYDITEVGNWEGVNIPNRLHHPDKSRPNDDAIAGRNQLRDIRAERIHPAKDDKILADWNGLAISALARAGFLYQRSDWFDAAVSAFEFVVKHLAVKGRLGHSWRAQHLTYPGLATDHANMIHAACRLYSFSGQSRYLEQAENWEKHLTADYWDDSGGGYYLASTAAEDIIVRTLSSNDEATPAANGVMAGNLVYLWSLTGNQSYRDRADIILNGSADAIRRNAFAFGSLLNAFDFRLDPISCIVVGPDHSSRTPLMRTALASGNPNLVIFGSESFQKFQGMVNYEGPLEKTTDPAAYICRNNSCSLPVSDANRLSNLLVPNS